jgi:hypothetical protein
MVSRQHQGLGPIVVILKRGEPLMRRAAILSHCSGATGTSIRKLDPARPESRPSSSFTIIMTSVPAGPGNSTAAQLSHNSLSVG